MIKNSLIVGFILFVIWLVVMVFWGDFQDIVIDSRSDGEYQSGQSFGHPLWND